MSKIVVSFPISAFNGRRYRKPWGAVVIFDGVKPMYDFTFCSYLGTDRGGSVKIMCEPGDIVAWGQKDCRRPDKSQNFWYIVEEDGSCVLVSRDDAYQHWSDRVTKDTAGNV